MALRPHSLILCFVLLVYKVGYQIDKKSFSVFASPLLFSDDRVKLVTHHGSDVAEHG